jgi:hypothetical protein
MRGPPIRINTCLKNSDTKYMIRASNLLAGNITRFKLLAVHCRF